MAQCAEFVCTPLAVSECYHITRTHTKNTYTHTNNTHTHTHPLSLFLSPSPSLSYSLTLSQVTLRLTPLREGDLEVLGFVYNLCVDTSQQKGSDSPLQPASRPNVPSMAISSRDSLYQKHQGSGVQMTLADGVMGRVDIRICGPRLNNTKVEKASMMYGHDYRLHWIVTAPMPKLVVSR